MTAEEHTSFVLVSIFVGIAIMYWRGRYVAKRDYKWYKGHELFPTKDVQVFYDKDYIKDKEVIE